MESKNINILLTGATGSLGYRTLERLVTLPGISKIKASGRLIKPHFFVNHPKAEYVLGSLSDESYVKKLVQNVDVIIHTAALSSPWGREIDFYNANVLPQILLLKHAEIHQIKRFIFISSPSIYFNGKSRLQIKESDPLPATFVNEYARTKFEAEKILEKSYIPYIILRPRAIIGRGDTVIMPRLIRAQKEAKLKIIGSGKNVVDLTSVANVVAAITASMVANEQALNQAYNISNGKPVILWNCITEVLQLLDLKLDCRKIPYSLALALAQLLELKSKISNWKEPVLTKYSVGTLALDFTMDISKAKNLLGYEPKVSVGESIHEFVKWYKENDSH